MLLYDLIQKCYNRDKEKNKCEQCIGCSYGSCCPDNCGKCLEYVHFPNKAPSPRTYDCRHMADYYYCKYAYRYASEIVYGLKQFTDIQNIKDIKIMSVGCGPCTDLAAVEYLRSNGVFNFHSLEYIGIDPLENVWGGIWRDICDYFRDNIEFYPYDIFNFVDIIVKTGLVPDILVFQYVFSDMYKRSEEDEIKQFIDKLSLFINSCAEKPIYIVCNDINLCNSMGGGREFFDELESRIDNPKIVRRRHFNNIHKETHYEYGSQYNNNALVFDDIIDDIWNKYNPFDSCASAQILIKKEVTK